MAKKQKTNKKHQKISSIYQIKENKLEKNNKFCPKCGEGIFLAKHKERFTCGKCEYTEFIKS